MFDTYYYEFQDPYNIKNNRNAFNTDRFSYNCAGYALGTFSWYVPYDMDDCYELDELRDELQHCRFQIIGSDDKEKDYILRQCDNIRSEITKIYVQQMLFDFAGLRVISNFSEVDKNERIILFRVSDDGNDFHYIWSDDGKQWRHKMGSSILEDYDAEYIFDDWIAHDRFVYNGEIIIFALRMQYKGQLYAVAHIFLSMVYIIYSRSEADWKNILSRAG